MLIIKLFLVFKLSSLLYIGKLVKKVNIVLEYWSFWSKEFVLKSMLIFLLYVIILCVWF